MIFPDSCVDVEGFGALPRGDKLGDFWPIFEDQVPVIPRGEWAGLSQGMEIRKQITGRIKKQTRSSCASHSLTSCMEYTRNRCIGRDKYIELSPMSLYQRVTRTDSGSTLSAKSKLSSRR